ncbi:MAG: winged helix-turn-helix domain-containing protein [Gemmatimonadales bacterium]
MARTRVETLVAPVAALLADPARAAMLWALADGRALPAGELARSARVSASTASFHLAKLLDGGLVADERHGRHRYFRLATPEVAAALEALAVVGQPHVSAVRPNPATFEPMRFARSCYDHLAGHAGVALTDALIDESRALTRVGRIYRLTPEGREQFARIGIDAASVMAAAERAGRQPARACLDWSERRYHLAGVLGRVLLERVLELEWFQRRRGTRALKLTNLGRRALQREFGVRLM